MGSHAFNPRTEEVETEVIWLGGKRNIRQEETGVQDQSEASERQMQFEYSVRGCSLGFHRERIQSEDSWKQDDTLV